MHEVVVGGEEFFFERSIFLVVFVGEFPPKGGGQAVRADRMAWVIDGHLSEARFGFFKVKVVKIGQRGVNGRVHVFVRGDRGRLGVDVVACQRNTKEKDECLFHFERNKPKLLV